MSDKKKETNKKDSNGKNPPLPRNLQARAEASASDRRRFSRVSYTHAIAMRNRTTGKRYNGGFSDISLYGMLYLSDPLPTLGESLEGELTLGEEAIVFRGNVVYVHPDRGAAVQFVDMDIESFSHLRRLVALNMGDSEKIDQEFFRSL